ncbi:kinase-like domain-containing protein [Mycena capillaripes]|nr:kinase-like domain-containing protein [Mycena capillaripes]
MDVLIDRPMPAGLKFSRFLKLTLPKLVRSYGELIVISEEVEVPGDLLCLMQNALLLIRLSAPAFGECGSDVCIEEDHSHVLLKALLYQVTAVRWYEKQHICITTDHGNSKIAIAPGNSYYRNWQPYLKFLTARRIAFEIRLRTTSRWTEEDDKEADFFAGDIPAADRATPDQNPRLVAAYGSILNAGDVKQHTSRQTLWRTTKCQLETRFLVLREFALLIYRERAVPKPVHSSQDRCINLQAVKAVTSLPESDSSILILTRTKSFPLLCESAAHAKEWIRSIKLAVEKIRSSPGRERISALERVNHLTTQITTPPDPYASGAFANVYKGTWEIAAQGLRPGQWQKRTVAVKIFLDRKLEGPVFEKRLRREVNVWCRLDHPNVVPLLGITYDFGTSLSMVSPWLHKGTLHMYLESREARLGDSRPLLIDIASGLSYLHLMKVIHGDLHPGNILIGDDGRAQLTDFGLSMIVPDFEGTSYMTMSGIAGAVRWAAPEVFRIRPNGDTSLNVSTMSDVYSFGGIMYQVLCGEIPFANITSDLRVMFAVITDGQRPQQSRAISTTNWEFIWKCWDGEPTRRPSLMQILEFLEQVFNHVTCTQCGR